MTALWRFTPLFLVAAIVGARPRMAQTPTPRAVTNDNRTPGGRMHRDTVVLRLTVTTVDWHILGDDEPAFTVLAFAEEGKPPTIPGPLIRVPRGTPVQVRLSNPLNDTLIVYGLGALAGRDSLLLLPGASNVANLAARPEGTYQYWATSAAVLRHTRAGLPPNGVIRRGFDSQLAGAIVIDPPGPVPPDRIFVISQLADRDASPGSPESKDRRGIVVRQFGAINGRTWPHTERLHQELGDSVRWRIVNASPEAHPMHLHGFYFRVDSRGSPALAFDSIYPPEQRRMVVTETISPRHTAAIVWSPDTPGGWLFHCHLTSHVAKMPPIDRREVRDFPAMHHAADSDQHGLTGMNGMVLGITVTGQTPEQAVFRPARRIRLFVQSDSSPGDLERRFGYVVQRGAEPRRDSVEYPGPVLVLTRGEPTSIEVVNRSGEPTAVHWHGIELESYFDGVPGWSGTPGLPRRTATAVQSGKSFEVRLTPKRAGTFMYHTHFDELRQQFGGLVGALIVLEPGERWEPERDLVFLLSDGSTPRMFINGSLEPAPKELEVGQTYRLRIADIAVFRMSLSVRLLRDSTLVQWRPVAKDGFALPPAQATLRPSIANVPTGETADFEFTPDAPGDLMLVVGLPGGAPQGSVRLRVSGRR